MATDYDAPRNTTDETESIEVIKESAAGTPRVSDVDMDESDLGGFSAGETIAEDLDIVVLPPQVDEFTCTQCFIVKHHSQLADAKNNICIECA